MEVPQKIKNRNTILSRKPFFGYIDDSREAAQQREDHKPRSEEDLGSNHGSYTYQWGGPGQIT